MRAYEIQNDFGFDNLKQVEKPSPEPDSHQIVLDLKSVSINYRDIMTIRGHYNPNQPLPLIPFSDGVGVVSKTGDEVSRVKTGDRVIPIFAQDWIDGSMTRNKRASTLGGPRSGTLAEKICLHERGVVKAPEFLTDEEACTLPCAGVTAWNALTGSQTLKPGKTVLLQGTGGVSIFGLQIAKMNGAEVIMTSSSDEKLELAHKLGADHTINYTKNPDWDENVRECTNGNGVDFIVEVGGAETLQKSLKSAAPEAQISVIGVLSGGVSDLSITPILMKRVQLNGIFVGSRHDLRTFCNALSTNDVHPWVDQVFSFDQTLDALEYVQNGEHIGKVAIQID